MILNTNYKPLVNAYAKYLQTLGFASTTVYNYPRFITTFLEYLQSININHIKFITNSIVKNYFTHLENTTGKRTNKAFSTSHLNTHFFAMDKFLEFLNSIGMQNAPLPPKYTIEHQAQKTIVVLTTEQIKILYNTVPFLYAEFILKIREPRQACARLVLDLCYGCGLRRSEALNLKISDINFDTKIIHIKQGKNYKDRLVPMSEGVYKSIQNFVYQYRTHFVNKRTGYVYPYTATNIKQILHLLIKQCNNTEIKQNPPSPHSLRHSIATHLLQKGMSIDNIARFLGHSTLQSTQIYTHYNTQ